MSISDSKFPIRNRGSARIHNSIRLIFCLLQNFVTSVGPWSKPQKDAPVYGAFGSTLFVFGRANGEAAIDLQWKTTKLG